MAIPGNKEVNILTGTVRIEVALWQHGWTLSQWGRNWRNLESITTSRGSGTKQALSEGPPRGRMLCWPHCNLEEAPTFGNKHGRE